MYVLLTLSYGQIFIGNVRQGKEHDGIPAGMIDVVWHSSLQGKDANGWDPKEQLEGGWNATFAFLVRFRLHDSNELRT